MKSFFKKLAFVMALAMVVSMAAPAATTASAASDLKIAYQNGKGYGITELNIAEVGATEDLKFLGAPSNWKELGATWTSNNEAVATVDQAGVVTAVAPGTADVAVQIGAEVAVVKVNVVNVATYTATMGTADDRNITAKTIEEGETFDFAFYGIKDYDVKRYFCTWASDDTSVATVDQKGLVTAVKAGTAKITLIVFNKVTGQVHNVDACTVTVPAEATPTPAANAFTVAQKDTDKFILTFAEAKTAEAIEEGLELSVKIGEQNYPISFENVEVADKVVTITTYSRFEDGEVYTFTFGGVTETCTITLGDIASVGITYYTGKDQNNQIAYVLEEEENDYVTLVPALFDQFGNNVTEKYNLDTFEFVYTVSDNVSPILLEDDVFTFGKAGVATVDITATWITDEGELKEVAGQTSFAVQKRGKVNLALEKAGIAALGWQADDDIFTYETSKTDDFRYNPDSIEWTRSWIVSNTVPMVDTTDWTLNDWRGDLYYTAVFKDNRGNVVTSHDTTYTHGTFSYESTNSEVVDIDADGKVTRNKAGKANILVYFTPADGTESQKLVASTLITVTPQAYPVSYKVLTTAQTTAGHVYIDDEDLNNVTFYVQFYDQFGAVFSGYRDGTLQSFMKVEARDTNNGVTPEADSLFVWDDNKSAYKIVLDGSKFQGSLGDNNYKTYSYKFSLEDGELTDTIKTPYAVFSLTVKNTKTERDILAQFIDNGTLSDSSYKFNFSISGNKSSDVAVKNVIEYGNTWMQSVEKKDSNTKFDLYYLSTGNLKLARVPSDYIVDNTTAKADTGKVGYVYLKLSTPSKANVAGKSVDNNAWAWGKTDGKVQFVFNDVYTTAKFQDVTSNADVLEATGTASGSVFTCTVADSNTTFQYLSNGNVFIPLYGATSGTGLMAEESWSPVQFEDVVEGTTYYYEQYVDGTPYWREMVYLGEDTIVTNNFQHAGNGTYTVNFATANKTNNKLYTLTTSSVTVSNSSSQVQYLGLNPFKNGVTELSINDYVGIVKEQLRFSYEELFFGEYYDDVNKWSVDAWNVANADVQIDWANSKITQSTDGKSLTISYLVFELTVDDGNADTDYTYKTKVNVGARIKVK